MIRLLLLLFLGASAFGQSVFVKDPATAGSLGASATYLNTTSATFTRGTSAYNPITDAFAGPDVRRTRAEVIGTTSYNMDLMEGARTNLLTAGTSGRFDRWTQAAGCTSTADTAAAPDGEVIAQTVTDPGASLSSVEQTFTVANDSLIHVFSIYVLKTSGGTAPTFGVTLALTGGTGVTTNARINTDTGAQQYGSNANTTVETSAAGTWYRTIVKVTNNTSGNTTLTLDVYPAAAAYGASADDATATGSATLSFADLNKAAFASSFGSNRNLLLQTQVLNTTWTKTRTTIATDSTANPIDGATNADTIVEDNTGTNTHFILQTFTKAASPIQFTYSTYIKQSGRTWCFLRCSDSGITNGQGIYFDVANGVKGTAVGLGAGWTLDASAITAVGSWYRCSITVTTASATSISCEVYTATGDLGIIAVTPLNAAALICWGNQLVYGATIQNYVANTTAIGLRASDVLTATLASSTTAASVTCVARPYGWSGDQDGATTYYLADAASGPRIFRVGATALGARITDGGGAEGPTDVTPGLVAGSNRTVGMVYDSVSVRAYVQGSTNGTADTTLTPPYTASTVVGIGMIQAGTNQFYGWVSAFYWASVITPAQQQIFANGVTP